MGAYTLLQDLTVATNSTSVVLNDFGTITKDDFIKVVVNFFNPLGSDWAGELFPNTATTKTQYHRQLLRANGTGVVAGRANEQFWAYVSAGKSATYVNYLKLSENDRFNIFRLGTFSDDANIVLEYNYITSSGATFPNGIDTLTFLADRANGIGTGSRIQIYKLAAEKVRDIIVETNSTQVDIPTTGIFDPAIDKDSEYLLVSDVENNDNAVRVLALYPNDLTTPSNYHSQMVAGDGSGTFASRSNTNQLEFIRQLGKTICYTHIKLSNIGAFTFQNYALRAYGTTLPEIRNFFVSSTAENITSITKLNIVASGTNAIKAGSRFTLYKLYE